MPKRWLVKRRWFVVLEATTYTRIHGQQQLGKCLCVAGNQREKIFVVKLYSRKIFSYVFFVQKCFYNENEANYSRCEVIIQSDGTTGPVQRDMSACNYTQTACTTLSQASALPCASTHPSILTVLWFFKVLRVTTHHAKSLCGDSKVGTLSSCTPQLRSFL